LEITKEITEAIRTVDKKHIIIIEGNGWGNNYNGLIPLWDNNMASVFINTGITMMMHVKICFGSERKAQYSYLAGRNRRKLQCMVYRTDSAFRQTQYWLCILADEKD
jgi:hypothetical protein